LVEVTHILIASFLLAIIGYLAQTTGLCMVRGVQEALAGKPSFLLAILFSGTLGWFSLVAALIFGIENPFTSYHFHYWSILGGCLFGIGAALNNGCGVSTVSKLARGQVVMVSTVLGWIIGWQLEELLVINIVRISYAIPQYAHFSVLITLSLCLITLTMRFSKEERKTWLSMLAIGLVAGVAFLLEPNWTPSSLLRDLSLSRWDSSSSHWPTPGRFFLFMSLIGGMIGAAMWTKSFELQSASLVVVLRHLLAGTLMGVGAAIAGGGNDSLLLLALPALSLSGLTAVLSIVIGIYFVKGLFPMLRGIIRDA
jgi:hypothetical protein